MTHQQFKLILERVRNNLDQTEFENNAYSTVKSIKSRWPGGAIEIRAMNDEIKVSIKPNGSMSTEGKIKYPAGWWIFRVFMLSWWRWRSLCRIAEREYERRKKIDKQNAIKWEQEKVDEALVQTFPDIIEKHLLGDDDD